MSLREYERRRVPDAPLSTSLDDQVLTFPEWCQLNRISERTGRRILASPDPKARPVVTLLSAHRIGVTIKNNRIWQQSRARA